MGRNNESEEVSLFCVLFIVSLVVSYWIYNWLFEWLSPHQDSSTFLMAVIVISLALVLSMIFGIVITQLLEWSDKSEIPSKPISNHQNTTGLGQSLPRTYNPSIQSTPITPNEPDTKIFSDRYKSNEYERTVKIENRFMEMRDITYELENLKSKPNPTYGEQDEINRLQRKLDDARYGG